MKTNTRKYIKTKFEGVFYRYSTKHDPGTGEPDKLYCFWYSDAEGKGHWKTVGRHSQGIRPPFVRQKRAEFLSALVGEPNFVARDRVTVGDAVGTYVQWARCESKHVDIPLNLYTHHLHGRLHNVPIVAITPSMLTTIKAQLLATPKNIPQPKTKKSNVSPQTLSAQTVHHLFSFVRRAINRAIAEGLWAGQNPLASKRGGAWQMPKLDNKCLRFLTPEETNSLIAELGNHSFQLRDMALLALKTGLRATEIFQLRTQDVDTHSAILHVLSKGGKREAMHISPDVVVLLQQYMRTGGDLLFPKRGTELPMDATSSTFGKVVRKLGLHPANGDRRYAVTFHTLRHTFASWLAQSGKVSLLELKKLMRHESLTMTQRYAHLMPGQEKEKLSIIEDVLSLSSTPKDKL